MNQSKKEVSRSRIKNILNLLVLMLLAAAILIFLQSFVIPYYVNSYISQFLPIKKLDFQQNRWITINDANIFHVHRLGSVHPNEELTVELRITNPTNETLGYHPLVSVIGGNNDKRDYQEYTTWWVQPYQKDSISLPFFAGNEGDNEIKVSLQVRDIHGNKFPDEFSNSTAIFGVLSTVELLENQNSTLQNSLIVSSVIGALTFIALSLTWYSSKEHTKELKEQNTLLGAQNNSLREQNEFIQKQAIEQNRPWIGIGITPPVFTITQDRIFINLKNYGNTPAIDIVTKGTVKKDTLTIEEVKQSPILARSTMAPNETWHEAIPIPSDFLTTVDTSDKCYCGIHIEYKYHGDKIGTTEIIARLKSRTDIIMITKNMI